MGLLFSRRKKIGKNTTANLSKGGISLTRKAGPASINSRGRVTVRLGKGLSFRF